MSYIDELIENCRKAKAASPLREFVVEHYDQLGDERAGIYVIEEVGGDPEKTFRAMSDYKRGTQSRACPKLNHPSPVLYVGSSTTGLKSRIKQHVGDGPAGTYALHLKHWFDGNYRIIVRIYDEPAEVLQIIEDALSHDMEPAFGKKGGNNKG